MKSKPSTKSAPNAEPVVPTVAPTSAAAPRTPRARKTATVPAVVHVSNDVAGGVVSKVVNGDAAPVVLAPLIAIRAYALFVAHGFEQGRDLEHWLAAEREILGHP